VSLKNRIFAALALLLAVVGYFFGAIVVAIYAALALGKDKMAFETGITPHLFGAGGALAGIALAWGIVKLVSTLLERRKCAAQV
jgi:predicted Abi (CAAX) family protease